MISTPTPVGNGPGWLRRFLGEARDQARVAHRLAVASAVVLFVGTTVLIATHAAHLGKAGDEKARVVELEGRTKDDAEVAVRLHEERKRQTEESRARETRNRVFAWVLLVAGGAFVASGKWWVSLRPERVPSLEELVAVRFGDKNGRGNEDALGNGRGEGAGAEGIGAAGARKGKRDAGARGGEDVGARGEGGGNVATETVDLDFVDRLIDRFGRDKEAAIPILQAIQSHFRYLPDEALRYVCERTEITPAQIAGTSSFYAQFRRSPVGRHVVRVCHGTACHVAGAEQITEELRRHLKILPGEDTDPQRQFTIDQVACLGCCSLAPVMMIGEDTAGRLTPATARQALDAVARAKKT